jgi:hypothetical protein
LRRWSGEPSREVGVREAGGDSCLLGVVEELLVAVVEAGVVAP